MQLTAQEEYGLRCLLQVAKHSAASKDAEPLGIAQVASAEGLSMEYTAKLMRVLRQAGFVVSTRGASGGYLLSRSADEITAWEVLSTLGGPLYSEAFCGTHPGNRSDCVHTTDCSLRVLWNFMGDALKQVLSHVTLTQLCRGEAAMQGWLHGGGAPNSGMVNLPSRPPNRPKVAS